MRKYLLILCLFPIVALIADPAQGQQTEKKVAPPASEAPKAPAAPKPSILADIIPSAMKLSGNVAELENKLREGPDISDIQTHYGEIESKLDEIQSRMENLKDLQDFGYQGLTQLKQALDRENDLLERTNKPIRSRISLLETWRQKWLAERKKWKEWEESQSDLIKDGSLEELGKIFDNAERDIDKALGLIVGRLQNLLTMQQKSGAIQNRINSLSTEVERLILSERRDTALIESPLMFSSEYLGQFRPELLHRALLGVKSGAWLSRSFFSRQGWAIFLHLLITLLIIITAYRNREALQDSHKVAPLLRRPISGGIFLGAMMTVFFYDYRGVPEGWRLGLTIVGGIAFVRLVSVFTEDSWKKWALGGLVALMAMNKFATIISLPSPLLRLYIVIASLIVSLYCLKWSTTFFKREGPGLWIHILRLGALLFLVIAFLQIFGKEDAAQYLFNVAVRSLVILMAFRLLAHLINGGLEWAMRNFLGPFLSLTEEEIVSALRHASFIVNTMVGFFVFCVILFNARIYGNLQDAAWGILNLGWDAGPVRITIGALASAAVIVYSAFLLSKLLQKLFIERELARRQVERGVRLSIAGLTHYVLVFIGLLIGLFALGFDLTKVTIVLSALGVGIGFGLQNIVNNFVSGIVLLMEQPVRVGDYIEVDGSWAEIKNIGLRATTVRTFDYADIIVPNADLMTNRVINWTLSTRVVRVTVPVGVAYGSDIELVMEKLLACARENPQVATIPEPQVLFLRFGDSALEFELRAWVWDADEKLRVTSDLHSHICRRFREAKIEIAFPQMDLHVRDINDSISLKKPESIQE